VLAKIIRSGAHRGGEVQLSGLDAQGLERRKRRDAEIKRIRISSRGSATVEEGLPAPKTIFPGSRSEVAGFRQGGKERQVVYSPAYRSLSHYDFL